MKAIITRRVDGRPYDEVGTDNRWIADAGNEDRLRRDMRRFYRPGTYRAELFYGDNIYKTADKIIEVTV